MSPASRPLVFCSIGEDDRVQSTKPKGFTLWARAKKLRFLYFPAPDPAFPHGVAPCPPPRPLFSALLRIRSPPPFLPGLFMPPEVPSECPHHPLSWGWGWRWVSPFPWLSARTTMKSEYVSE